MEALQAFGPLPTSVDRRDVHNLDNDDTTAATIAQMKEYVEAGARSRLVIEASADALRDLPDLAPASDVAFAIFQWIKSHITFVTDEEICQAAGVGDVVCGESEWLIQPERLLSMPSPRGDCDDFSMLTCAMLLAAGVDCEFTTVAADKVDPQRFSHVYAVALLPDGRLAMDTSHGAYPGWEVGAVTRRQGWGGLGSARPHLHGLPIDDQVLGGARSGGDRIGGERGMGQIDLTEWGLTSPTSTSWWREAIGTGLDIAKTRYGQAPVGTYFRRSPSGEIVYERPIPGFPLSVSGSGMPSWAFWGGAAVLGVILISAMRGR